MAKKSAKGPARKHVHMAAQARKERTRHLYYLLIAVLGGILAWCVVSFTPINDHSIAGSVVIFGAAIIIVIVIGEVGVRYSRCNNEYKRILGEYGIEDASVKEFIKKNK